MKIKNHTVLITGGTSGIGRELARALAKDNRVIVTGRSEQRLTEARKDGLTAWNCDLTVPRQIEALVVKLEQEFPQLDILINNAGIQFNYNLLETPSSYEKINREITTNLTGTIHLTQLLLPLLSTKPSTIINLTSALGTVPKSDGLVYSAGKAGLRNFTAGLRKVLRNKSVRVLEIIPPVTDTRMTAERGENKMPVDELVRIILRQWERGYQLIAPGKVKFLLLLQRSLPGLADRLIG
ncbi:SDR family oxidoreductase [Flavilitoribacter nigricans]|nr:SDR family NAD(P)-dependent oxidoreductase [Flavilitoribacter nigricans]